MSKPLDVARADPFADPDEQVKSPEAGLGVDLAAFKPKSPGQVTMRPNERAALDQVAQISGFARQDARPAGLDAVVAPATPRQQRRHRTGRNVQINLKVTEETTTTFYRLLDELRITQGELLERALAAFERELKG